MRMKIDELRMTAWEVPGQRPRGISTVLSGLDRTLRTITNICLSFSSPSRCCRDKALGYILAKTSAEWDEMERESGECRETAR